MVPRRSIFLQRGIAPCGRIKIKDEYIGLLKKRGNPSVLIDVEGTESVVSRNRNFHAFAAIDGNVPFEMKPSSLTTFPLIWRGRAQSIDFIKKNKHHLNKFLSPRNRPQVRKKFSEILQDQTDYHL